MLIYICNKECRYVAVCEFILCVRMCVCVWVPTGQDYVLVWDFSVLSEVHEL